MIPAFPARRRADEFDRLLRESADASTPSDLRELAALATDLSTVSSPQPSAAFSAGLRERLMIAAATDLVASPATTRTSSATADRLTVRRPATTTGGRRKLTAGLAALAIVGGTAGTALASQNALPGDALYPVKRALESLHTKVAVSQESRDSDLLAEANNRLTEVHELTRRASVGAADQKQISATLATFSSQAQQASAAMIEQYRSSHDPASLAKLQSFTSDSMDQLSELAAVVPQTAQGALSTAAQTLLVIDRSVRQLCGSDCAPALHLPSSLVQSLAQTVQDVSNGLQQGKPATTGKTTPPPVTSTTVAAPQDSEKPGGKTAPTQHISTAPSTNTPGGGGATKLTQPKASNLGDAVSGVASGVGGVVSGAASAVGGLLGSLLGGGKQ